MTFQIHNRGESLELLIYDDIGDGFFGGITAKQVVDAIAKDTDQINVRINSAGGDVFEGIGIYNALKRHKANVVVDVDALAASIASVITMAGDEIRIAGSAMLMIHNPFTMAVGDSREMRRIAELLDQAQDNILNIYSDRTGKPVSELQELTDAETWLVASEALDLGFADTVTNELSIAAAAFDPARFRNTPERFSISAANETPSPAWKRLAAERRLRLTGGTR